MDPEQHALAAAAFTDSVYLRRNATAAVYIAAAALLMVWVVMLLVFRRFPFWVATGPVPAFARIFASLLMVSSAGVCVAALDQAYRLRREARGVLLPYVGSPDATPKPAASAQAAAS